MRNKLFFLVLSGIISTNIYAQKMEFASVDNSNVDWEHFEKYLNNTDWTFHANLITKTLYIDFENLGGRMSLLVLKNEKDEEIKRDDNLIDLPNNTIYELNLAQLVKGKYSLELHTFNSIIKEEFVIN